jgi:hypothetical protein
MKRATGTCLAVLAALVIVAPAWGDGPAVVGWRDRVVITASLPGMTAADRVVRQKLDETVVSFTFNEQPLEEAMDFLAALGHFNIVIDHRKVEAGKTLTLKLTDVSLLTALKLAVEQASLKWTVRDGVVIISDQDGIKSEPVTVVYDVSDMLAVPPDFEGPTIELGAIGSSIAANKNSKTTEPWPKTIEEPKEKKESEKTREELLQEIVALVKQMIESGTWDTESTP